MNKNKDYKQQEKEQKKKNLNKKDVSDRLHHSLFIITINTNKSMNMDQAHYFNESLNFLFSPPKVYEYLKEKRDGKTFTQSKIFGYKFKKKVEIGKKFGRAHGHIILNIDHRMILALNEAKIRAFYLNMLGEMGFINNKIHLNIKGKNNDAKTWEDYIFKEDGISIVDD